MRYFLLLAIVVSLWMMAQEFLLRDRSAEGLDTFGDKLRDLGKRLHVVFGILAILIVVIIVARLLIEQFTAD